MSSELMLLADTIHTSDRDLPPTTIASVVITGIVVVFIGLIILIALVWIYGKIFSAINSKAEAKAKAAAEEKVKAQPPEPVKTAPAAAPIIEDGIEEEVAAVIAAAIAAYGAQTGKKLAVKSIRRSASAGAGGRNAWSAAGLLENTRPF